MSIEDTLLLQHHNPMSGLQDTTNPNQATQHPQMEGDASNPNQATQHQQMGGDTSNPNQATQYLQMGRDTSNPGQITQHPQMGGDTLNLHIWRQKTQSQPRFQPFGS